MKNLMNQIMISLPFRTLFIEQKREEIWLDLQMNRMIYHLFMIINPYKLGTNFSNNNSNQYHPESIVFGQLIFNWQRMYTNMGKRKEIEEKKVRIEMKE